MIFGLLLGVFAMLAAVPAPVWGQSGDVEVSLLGVWHNKTTVIDALRGMGLGLRAGVRLPAGFQIEGSLDQTFPSQAETGEHFRLRFAGANLLYNPKVFDGAAYLRLGYGRFAPTDCMLGPTPCGRFSAAVFGGGGRIPIAPHLSVRIDASVRRRKAYDFTSYSLGAGLSWTLRRHGGSASNADADLDGVPDRLDRCPNTPAGALVDSHGCTQDHDGDGVPDGLDRCPRTPPDTPVNAVGCSEAESRG
jgi:hypothetical protein